MWALFEILDLAILDEKFEVAHLIIFWHVGHPKEQQTTQTHSRPFLSADPCWVSERNHERILVKEDQKLGILPFFVDTKGNIIIIISFIRELIIQELCR